MTDDNRVNVDWDNSFRCPHCGALNDLAAEWCMQCSKRFAPRREPVDMSAGTPKMSEIVSGGLGILAGDSGLTDDGINEAFDLVGDAVTWRCGRCQRRNPIEASVCEGCGRSFTESARWIADTTVVPKKKAHSTMKALGIVSLGAVLMRLVAGFVSPWAAFAVFGGVALRSLIRLFRT